MKVASFQPQTGTDKIEQIEITLLLEGLYRLFGYDFRQYSPRNMRRRIADIMSTEKLSSISALQDRVFHDSDVLNRLVSSLSVQVSEFFRDAHFFRSFREKAIPILRTYPQIRLWHAGCATGEEVYSMAILLDEEGLLDKALLYATDINSKALQTALAGTYPAANVEESESNYLEAAGPKHFGSYFEYDDRTAHVDRRLRDHIVFAEHNLVTDASFNEFNVILCRNVLIYFTTPLRNRVHALLHTSLTHFGLLGLGAKETIRFTAFEKSYKPLDEAANLYRRVD